MKKKGLIISTIVMVVVLIASLTTATYAWFNAQAQAKVADIEVKVTTESKVMIGVSKTNAFVETPAEANFRNGAVKYNWEAASEKWTNGNNGLGSSITTGVNMDGLTKACFPSSDGTGTDATTYTVGPDGSFDTNMARRWVKASGEATTLGLASTYEFAYANNYTISSTEYSGDYLDITFGVRAAQGGINKIALVVGFENATETNLGMATALNYWYQVKGDTASGLKDLYDNSTTGAEPTPNTLHYDSALSASSPVNPYTSAAWATADGLSWEPGTGDATAVIEIATGATDSTALTTTTIYQIHLIIFMNGWDSDCNNSAASVGIGDGSYIHLDFITRATA